ncbi:uncharacterized protein KY384_007825 [Bacidia gigantensis]|uniref:uncharacterized protein n=1 Tax=Bacidia gigantensis TaxID=2732470 RepID=UPI001D03CF38|nr:uncharacterized protein KY384_007825 [Bacidia gigantensis]KAG8527672.1 hypothetical protein KY384_007825 [Bacidia gigantensis]
MAEPDEGALNATNFDLDNVDESDETQDFRFLSALSQVGDATPIPKRGEKDFEQHGTRSQENALDASRQAMDDALSHTRLHKSTCLTGYIDSEKDSCMIKQPRGSMLATIGTADSRGHLHLLPEECLYLVERGSLNLQWQSEDLADIPLSLQAAYAYLIGSQGLTLERYIVYTSLKRSGYILQRTPTWYLKDYNKGSTSQPPTKLPPSRATLFSRLYAFLFDARSDPEPHLPRGPLIQPGLYRSYAPIYGQLVLIPRHDPYAPLSPGFPPLKHREPIRPTYNVWKPSTHFRKTAPPPPDYQICVLNARDDSFPTLEQLDDLMRCMPYDPPPSHMKGGGHKIYQRLKHGHRSVILAVVDQGIVSYVRIGDAGFSQEPVWEPKRHGRGGKAGGARGGARGRGRGRGRGR